MTKHRASPASLLVLSTVITSLTESLCFAPSYGVRIGNGRRPTAFVVRRNTHNAVMRQTTKTRTTSTTALCMAAKVGIFFGTSTGSTQDVADLIAAEFGEESASGPFDVESIQGKVKDEFNKYDALVVGTPTWNTGADTERSGTGWDEIYYGEMQDLSLSGKKVAVFGLGDQISYAENYADATGELHDVFENLGCKMMGYTSQEGYEHEASKSIRGDLFCGLLCDAVNQEDMSESRVQNWVKQLISEGILEGGGGGGGEVTTETPVAAPVVEQTSNAAEQQDVSIADLEKQNAELRKLLEEKTRLEEELASSAPAPAAAAAATAGGNDVGSFVPHTNKFGRTMWTSPDGRSCYYS